uniref:Putative secreted protein n=1 Tax=Ixodes scapularis TaxID=6945 RepID=A0A4D5RG63_IXOSC
MARTGSVAGLGVCLVERGMGCAATSESALPASSGQHRHGELRAFRRRHPTAWKYDRQDCRDQRYCPVA